MNNIVDDEDFNEVAYDISRRRVFRRPIIGQDTLNITSTEGDRVFLKLNADTENEKSNVNNVFYSVELQFAPLHHKCYLFCLLCLLSVKLQKHKRKKWLEFIVYTIWRVNGWSCSKGRIHVVMISMVSNATSRVKISETAISIASLLNTLSLQAIYKYLIHFIDSQNLFIYC